MADIFLSYARSDRDAARVVAHRLMAMGWKVWWDPELLPHLSYREAIDQELDAARCIMVLWSETSRQSAWVLSEASTGFEGRRLVQVSLDGARPPRPFDQFQAARLDGVDDEEHARNWRSIVASVTILAGPPQPPAVTQAPEPASAIPSDAGPARPPSPSPEPAVALRPTEAAVAGHSFAPQRPDAVDAVSPSAPPQSAGGLKPSLWLGLAGGLLAVLAAVGVTLGVMSKSGGDQPGDAMELAGLDAQAPPSPEEQEDAGEFPPVRELPEEGRTLVWLDGKWAETSPVFTDSETGERFAQLGDQGIALAPLSEGDLHEYRWQSAQEWVDTGDIGGLRDFMKKYPDNPFISQAQGLLETKAQDACGELRAGTMAQEDFDRDFGAFACSPEGEIENLVKTAGD